MRRGGLRARSVPWGSACEPSAIGWSKVDGQDRELGGLRRREPRCRVGRPVLPQFADYAYFPMLPPNASSILNRGARALRAATTWLWRPFLSPDPRIEKFGMIQSQLHRIWHLADHRPAIAFGVLSATFVTQSVVAHML